MRIAVTGANGYLGGLIINFLTMQNIDYVKLVRQPQSFNEQKFILGDDFVDLHNVDGLIHVAYDFNQINPNKNYLINVDGSSKLFNSARACGVKWIILISSMSSFKGCKSIYGQSKYLIENKLVESGGGYILRPGLIYGDKNGGMVASLKKLAKSPILPFISSKSKLYFCHYEDLIQLINLIIIGDPIVPINEPIIAANEIDFTLEQILQKMGSRILIPLPWQIIWLCLKVAEFFRIKLRTRGDNLISLVNQNPNPDFSLLKKTGIIFRKFVGGV